MTWDLVSLGVLLTHTFLKLILIETEVMWLDINQL